MKKLINRLAAAAAAIGCAIAPGVAITSLPAPAEAAGFTAVCDLVSLSSCLKINPDGSITINGGGGGGSTSTAPVVVISTPPTSATQLGANSLSNGVIFQVPSTNTGSICVGKDATVTTSTGYCLSPASGVTAGSLGVNNTNLVWVISSNGTDTIQFLGN